MVRKVNGASAANQLNSLRIIRSGLVESKLRQLVLKLELVEMLVLAHPYVKGIDKVHYCLNDQERQDAARGIYVNERTFSLSEGNMGADHLEQIKERCNLSEEELKNIKTVYTTTFYIGLYVEPKAGKCLSLRVYTLGLL